MQFLVTVKVFAKWRCPREVSLYLILNVYPEMSCNHLENLFQLNKTPFFANRHYSRNRWNRGSFQETQNGSRPDQARSHCKTFKAEFHKFKTSTSAFGRAGIFNKSSSSSLIAHLIYACFMCAFRITRQCTHKCRNSSFFLFVPNNYYKNIIVFITIKKLVFQNY